MKDLKSKMLCAAVSSFVACANAQSQTTDSSSVSKLFAESGGIGTLVGVRLWGNQWDIPVVDTVPIATPGGVVVLQDIPINHLSSFEIAVIPFIGVKIGNVVASASYMVRTDYNPKTPLLTNVSRDELDVNLGYSILPETSPAALVFSVGYKRADVKSTAHTTVGAIYDYSLVINGVIIGFSGSAPLTDNLRLYGNAAYGFAKQKFKNPPPLPGFDVNNEFDGRYRIGEVGVSYTFYHGGDAAAVRSASVSLGYRAQLYTIKSVALFTRNSLSLVPISSTTSDIDSTTQGVVLGLNASF